MFHTARVHVSIYFSSTTFSAEAWFTGPWNVRAQYLESVLLYCLTSQCNCTSNSKYIQKILLGGCMSKGVCLSTIGPFAVWKSGFSQATFTQGDTAFSEFVSTNKC